MSSIEKLLKDATGEGAQSSIEELLTLCDNIYYTGKNHSFKGTIYTLKDLPSDELYDHYRKEYTPTHKATDYFVMRTPKGATTGLVKHDSPMGSLAKYKGDDTAKLYVIFGRVEEIFISAKVDGVSLRCWFTDGNLVQALTRYDHQYGRVATDKASLFVTRPDPSFRGNIVVRGEVVMKGNNYKALGLANRRNGAAGIFGQEEKYTNVKEELHFVAYELTEFAPEDGKPLPKGIPKSMPDTMSERLNLLSTLG
ncbi:MAG TPA: hypothetical protein VJ044_17230, partial [Candidatus Hodarchaeales archaeon]|nr:hypothetical protein [Candidatus Hodarchaeales archaeon]